MIKTPSTDLFLRRGQQLEENISRSRTVLSPTLLYYSSLMGKRYLAMGMWLCKGKLKVKIAHFWYVPVRVSKTRVLNLPICCIVTSVLLYRSSDAVTSYQMLLCFLDSLPILPRRFYTRSGPFVPKSTVSLEFAKINLLILIGCSFFYSLLSSSLPVPRFRFSLFKLCHIL